MEIDEYVKQSRYSDPGRHAHLLDELPSDIRELAAVMRNVVVHYRASGFPFTRDRLTEIDNRWVERILDTDQVRFAQPLAVPRPQEQRVVGCCRDFALLTVAALRHQGVPARTRIGFAPYFSPDFHYDHVIVEFWDGSRWVWVDAETEPGPGWQFDTCDMPRERFDTAARVWTAFRDGKIDVEQYGANPDLPYRGGWYVRNYVWHELAHRMRDELLLWDEWGVMSDRLDGDLRLADEIAALLLAADGEDEGAERELADRYARDSRLRPGERVKCFSPTEPDDGFTWIDLAVRV